jgi:hypothetical protein
MLSSKIIEYLKKSRSKNFQQVNREPHLVYPAIEGMTPLYDLYAEFAHEAKSKYPQSISYGEKYGSPNTKKALKWYKEHVSNEQYINSQYYAKVLKRIPGKRTMDEDWHIHDNNSHRQYIYLISSINTTPILNLQNLNLPALPRKIIKKSYYFPIVHELIKKGLIKSSDIFKSEPFQFTRIHKSTLHMSEIISDDKNIIKEPYRWFMYIKY